MQQRPANTAVEQAESRKSSWQNLLDDVLARKETFEFWREPRVLEVTGLRPSTMRAMVADGHFPAPVKLGERQAAWPSILVEEWQRQRLSAAQQAA